MKALAHCPWSFRIPLLLDLLWACLPKAVTHQLNGKRCFLMEQSLSRAGCGLQIGSPFLTLRVRSHSPTSPLSRR
ncbi:hypothetical protein BD769DRAFT_1501623 [Suillus cothurnatus]|nr:hypothetical protein BD769DRAFT_1501623 [Suillus cothurnatus]